MGKIKVYLDNCCFNRPYDNQTYLLVRLETESKLLIQQEILNDNIDLVWSFILHFENNDNPYIDKKEQILLWELKAKEIIVYSEDILQKAKAIMPLNIREKDALHLACAIHATADYFITTDKKLLNKSIQEISIINPIDFVRRHYDES